MDVEKKFKALHPDLFLLHSNLDRKEWQKYLREMNFILPDEKVLQLEKPGEGNMNYVQRVYTDRRKLIVKQSRPWVEKYPQVKAPIDRIGTEHAFYEAISKDSNLSAYSPGVIGTDLKNHILILEDLGKGHDYTFLYQPESQLDQEEVDALIDYISRLHHTENIEFPDNQEMKTLNHEHIFVIPYQEDNGFDLDSILPGLQNLATRHVNDRELKERITRLGKVYLSTGKVLLHGDYYPGSWLKAGNELKVIDPEFAFLGRPEFDLGVMLAHFKLAHLDEMTIQKVLINYQRPGDFDVGLFAGFAGVEIMRRIIGLAQLPLAANLDQRNYLLEEAHQLIMQPDSSYLLQMITR